MHARSTSPEEYHRENQTRTSRRTSSRPRRCLPTKNEVLPLLALASRRYSSSAAASQSLPRSTIVLTKYFLERSFRELLARGELFVALHSKRRYECAGEILDNAHNLQSLHLHTSSPTPSCDQRNVRHTRAMSSQATSSIPTTHDNADDASRVHRTQSRSHTSFCSLLN
jgi:hypothetical protein